MDLSTIGLKNHLYSKQELDIVRQSRQACTEKFKVLQDEIRQLKTQIQRLDIALAPHNKLPPEVLRRIFELNCDKPTRLAQGYIFTISHVCSLWRQIALSTPEFWTNILISLKRSNEHRDHQLQIAEQWLLRAGNRPRSLIFVDNTDTKLHLSLPHTQAMPLKELLNGSFSSYLEILDIRCSETMLKLRWPNLLAPTTRLTKLIHLKVSERFEWNVQSLITIIPWNQLQYLDLESWFPYPLCLDILSECTSLVHCCINVDDSPVAMSSARRPIILPVLRILQLFFRETIHGNEGSHVEQMIQFLSVPRLSHLTLNTVQGGESITLELGVPAICELLERSNGMPDLVSLDLGMRRPPSSIDVQVLLKNTSKLQMLLIRYGIFFTRYI